MLEPWMIEELRRREREEQENRPFLELPLYEPREERKEPEEPKEERGVVIIQLL